MSLNKDELLDALKEYVKERPISYAAMYSAWGDFLSWLDTEPNLTTHEADKPHTCPSCKGKGWIRGQIMMVKCSGCNGTGHV